MADPIVRGMFGQIISVGGQPMHLDMHGQIAGIRRDMTGRPVSFQGRSVSYPPGSTTSEEVGGLPVRLNRTGEPDGITGLSPRPVPPPPTSMYPPDVESARERLRVHERSTGYRPGRAVVPRSDSQMARDIWTMIRYYREQADRWS